MKNPIPILSIWTLDYIANHLNEMHAILDGREIAILPDTEPERGMLYKSSITNHKRYFIRDLKSYKAAIGDNEGDTYTYPYKSLGLLDVTDAELTRAIETQKSYILNAEMEIQKFTDWKNYMEENQIKVFNVNSFNSNYLLEVLKQVQNNKADLTVDELKKIVSTITTQ